MLSDPDCPSFFFLLIPPLLLLFVLPILLPFLLTIALFLALLFNRPTPKEHTPNNPQARQRQSQIMHINNNFIIRASYPSNILPRNQNHLQTP
ncbi:hypothetical protein BO71DRAFT_394149 [Aspergillus ellipticus CBS 707.79]|uniref:Uncharacterized protein n=1 Tax=Aspergillus ellipticus CBS 707.79 TaxID=1448320 RepID=A0A319DQD9_9EURO|nr:hypothetical protein BO71DRAFT_394149 [Aspergillus ellipticus CBS 707.79]